MEVNTRNLDDFKKALDKLRGFENISFEYMTMLEAEELLSFVEGVLSEWRYLEDEIEGWIGIVEIFEEY